MKVRNHEVPIIVTDQTPGVRKLLAQITRHQKDATLISPSDAVSKFLEERRIDVLVAISRMEKDPKELTPALHPGVLRAVGYLRDHVSERISLQQLAHAAYVSKFHLCRLFKQDMGKTVGAYLMFFRINRAKELLRSAVPIGVCRTQSFCQDFLAPGWGLSFRLPEKVQGQPLRRRNPQKATITALLSLTSI